MIDKELIHQAAEDIDIFQADLTEEYERLRKPQPRKLRLWPLAVAACIAGFVAIFLVPPREVNVEPEKQPVVAQQTEKPEKPVVKEEPAEAIVAVETPTKPKRAHRRRPVVQQETAEEPLLAEVETTEEAPTENIQQIRAESVNPYLLAAAQIREIRSSGERMEHEIARFTNNH